MLFNARSLVNKFSDFDAILDCQRKSVHLIAVTETWFSKINPARSYPLPSYRQFHRDRQDRTGGGIAVYVRQDISSREVSTEHIPGHLEVMWLHLKSSRLVRLLKEVYVCVLYSPPRSQHKEDLTDHIINMVDIIRSFVDNPAFIIMGDFNDVDSDVL